MGKTVLRPATYADIDQLLVIGMAMHQESPRFSLLPFSVDKVVRLFVSLIDDQSSLLLVAERDGELIGGVAGTICEHWFSEGLIASEYGVFVLPEHRGGVVAVRLIRAYIEWAQGKGVRDEFIQLGITTGVHPEETAELYRRIGLKQFGYAFGA